MASPSLALPGVLFVGEDDRSRLVAHLGAAAGWMIPKGILSWSHEVSVVEKGDLKEDIRREAKIVLPEEQIPKGRMPLSHQAALASPLVAVSSRLTQKLVDAGIRVHTVGADRVTSSFYYIAEGGGEEPVRVEGDLVAAVGAMLGERADNAAIERVLDGVADRLVRSLSKGRVMELALELAAALPRAAADGSGMQDVDLEGFEKELSTLVGASEKYGAYLKEIAAKLSVATDRKVEIPLYGDARKLSQGAFDITVGDRTVSLVTHERWLATGPLTEPTRPAKSEPRVEPKPTTPQPATAAPANFRSLAQPLAAPRPVSAPPEAEPSKPAASEPKIAQATEPAHEAATAEPIKQSGATERPSPAHAAAEAPIPRAAPIPAETPTTPVVVPARPPPEARMAEPRPPRDLAPSPPRAVPQKAPEKGFPWLIVLLIAAALAAAFYFFRQNH
jgi:hypothetical protein